MMINTLDYTLEITDSQTGIHRKRLAQLQRDENADEVEVKSKTNVSSL